VSFRDALWVQTGYEVTYSDAKNSPELTKRILDVLFRGFVHYTADEQASGGFFFFCYALWWAHFAGTGTVSHIQCPL
jgi:hypothetical protein